MKRILILIPSHFHNPLKHLTHNGKEKNTPDNLSTQTVVRPLFSHIFISLFLLEQFYSLGEFSILKLL